MASTYMFGNSVQDVGYPAGVTETSSIYTCIKYQ